jgi:tRNA threonylcarbamoyladenosine biosynthesis protein TsaB
MLLAIDTATRMAGLALYDPAAGRILGEETWYSHDNHSVELMPRVARLLDTQRLAPAGLTGLVVSLGPGSFTGLRTGLSTAKGLALALDLPLVGIPTLEVTARPHMGQRLPVWAILQAGRGRICAAHYVRLRGHWRRQGEYLLTTVEALSDQVEDEAAIFCGEIDAREADLIRRRLGDKAVLPTPAESPRRAAYLAEIGWERLSRGDYDNPVTLSPTYLHQDIPYPAPTEIAPLPKEGADSE